MLQEQVHVCRQWLETPLGQRMLDSEKQCIAEIEREFFGYHQLHISPWKDVALPVNSRIKHHINMNLTAPAEGQVQAIPEQLPFDENSVDLVILHHVMEFSQSPHQLLREVKRVLVPQGFVLCVFFNPLSLYGLRMLFSSQHSFWKQNAISRHRLNDWFSLLEFSKIFSKSCLHLPPVNNQRFIKLNNWQQGLGKALHSPFGGVNVMLGRNDTYAMTIKPDWKPSALKLPIRGPQVVQLQKYQDDKTR